MPIRIMSTYQTPGGAKMPDKNLAENLITALRYEYKTYSEILKLAESKTDSLVKNDVDAIVSLSEK